jgi:hypothetical protein
MSASRSSGIIGGIKSLMSCLPFYAHRNTGSQFFRLALRANTGTTVAPMTRRQPATNTRFFDRRKTLPEQFSTNSQDTGISLFALPHFGHGISLFLCF